MTKQTLFREICDIKYVIKNLIFAKEVIAAAPVERINLDAYRQDGGDDDPECGTLYCSFGWLARVPYFRSLGFGLGEYGQPMLNGLITDLENRDTEAVFGPHAFANLFTPAWLGVNDEALLKGVDDSTYVEERDLAVRRFELRIKQMQEKLRRLASEYNQAPSLPRVAQSL